MQRQFLTNSLHSLTLKTYVLKHFPPAYLMQAQKYGEKKIFGQWRKNVRHGHQGAFFDCLPILKCSPSLN